MERKNIFIIVLLLVFFSTSCSTVSNFIVINSSNADLEIEYQIKGIYKNPKRISAENIGKSEEKWQEFPNDDLIIDRNLKTIKLKLASNEALLITSKLNYMGHDSDDLEVERIKLSGKNGISEFEGKQVKMQFGKEDKGNYVIFYK